jgi:hypothetical protein
LKTSKSLNSSEALVQYATGANGESMNNGKWRRISRQSGVNETTTAAIFKPHF